MKTITNLHSILKLPALQILNLYKASIKLIQANCNRRQTLSLTGPFHWFPTVDSSFWDGWFRHTERRKVCIYAWRLWTVKCQLTGVNRRVSTVKCQLSTVKCQLSTVKCQLSTVMCHLSNVECHTCLHTYINAVSVAVWSNRLNFYCGFLDEVWNGLLVYLGCPT